MVGRRSRRSRREAKADGQQQQGTGRRRRDAGAYACMCRACNNDGGVYLCEGHCIHNTAITVGVEYVGSGLALALALLFYGLHALRQSPCGREG